MRFFHYAVLVSLIATSCAAPKTSPSVDMSATLGSEYVFRGATQNERGAVQGEVSAAIETGSGSAFVTVWGHMDHTNDTGDAALPDGNGGKFSEIDTIAGYSWGGDGLSYELGVIGYQFPNGVGASTNEVYGSVGFDNVPFAPTLAIYYDFDEVEGIYANLGASHGFDLGDDLSLGLGLSVGYSDEDHSTAYYGSTDSGLADLLASISLNWSPEDMPSFELGVHGSSIIDSDISDALEAGGIDGDTIFVMFSISRSY